MNLSDASRRRRRTIDAAERRNGITSHTERESRGTYEDWLTNYQTILDETEPGKLTGGLRGLSISEYLVNNVERIVVTPELHLHLGMINTINWLSRTCGSTFLRQKISARKNTAFLFLHQNEKTA